MLNVKKEHVGKNRSLRKSHNLVFLWEKCFLLREHTYYLKFNITGASKVHLFSIYVKSRFINENSCFSFWGNQNLKKGKVLGLTQISQDETVLILTSI